MNVLIKFIIINMIILLLKIMILNIILKQKLYAPYMEYLNNLLVII